MSLETKIEKIVNIARKDLQKINAKITQVDSTNIKELHIMCQECIDHIFTIKGSFAKNIFPAKIEDNYNEILTKLDSFWANIFTASDSTETSECIQLCAKNLESNKFLNVIGKYLIKLDGCFIQISKKAKKSAIASLNKIKAEITPKLVKIKTCTLSVSNLAPFVSTISNVVGEISEWSKISLYLDDMALWYHSPINILRSYIQNLTNHIRLEGKDSYEAKKNMAARVEKYLGDDPPEDLFDSVEEDLQKQAASFDISEHIQLDMLKDALYKIVELVNSITEGPERLHLKRNRVRRKADDLEIEKCITSETEIWQDKIDEKLKQYAEDSSYVDCIMNEVKKYNDKIRPSDHEVIRGYVNNGYIINKAGYNPLHDTVSNNPCIWDRDLAHLMRLGQIIKNKGITFDKPITVYKGIGENYLGDYFTIFDCSRKDMDRLRRYYTNKKFELIAHFLNRKKPKMPRLPIFISTTPDRAIAEGFGQLILAINIPKGIKILDLINECLEQQEFLLPRFLKFFFKKAVLYSVGGKKYVRIDVCLLKKVKTA